MNVVIIEDEYPAADRLKVLLDKTGVDVSVLDVLDSVTAACNWFSVNEAPDLVLSDIQLSDGLSFEIFEQTKINCPIIFTTAYDEYAIKAFKLNSIDYLVKPIQPEELQAALKKYQTIRSSKPARGVQEEMLTLLKSVQRNEAVYKERFLVDAGEAMLPVFQTEIAYFTSANEITQLVRTDGKRFVLDYTLSDLEACLNPRSFFRANRQYLVQAPAIQRVFPYFNGRLLLALLPKARTDVIVSKSKASRFKRWFDGEV